MIFIKLTKAPQEILTKHQVSFIKSKVSKAKILMIMNSLVKKVLMS